MCYEHMLTQDPERLLEDEDLEEPETQAGSNGTETPDQRSRTDRVRRETPEVPA